ncbi:MAG: 2-dehydropantoate 2-reductase [Oscillospiraceae bacterium]|nr:2-dehydropantoate 2-reductase [Oscillospiraceae bacterium]
MKIAVAGAGAMGGRFGYALHQAGYDITFIDRWESHVRTIRAQGFRIHINGEDVVAHIPIFYPEELVQSGATFDVVILLTKSSQLDSMLRAIAPIVTRQDTYSLCLLNGIGHEKVIEQHIPRSNILLGNILWTAALVGAGHIKLENSGAVDLCELHPNGKATAQKMVEILEHAGLNATYSTDVYYTIYRKALLNCIMNTLCTILECNMHTTGTSEHLRPIMMGIIGEFAAVAAAEGVRFDSKQAIEGMELSSRLDGIGVHFPSTYQDLIVHNRLTEIDCLNGYIMERGHHHGIATPCCSMITQLIRCKEDILNAK